MTAVYIPVEYLYAVFSFYSIYLLVIEGAAIQTKKLNKDRGLPGLLAFILLVLTVIFFIVAVVTFGG